MRVAMIAAAAVAGGLASGPAQSSAAGGLPVVSQKEASAVSQTGATIEAGIDPQASATSYEILLECQNATRGTTCEPLTVGAQRQVGTLPADSAVHTVTAVMTGLQPGYLYKYDVIATNAAGREGYVGSGFITCPATGSCPPQPYLGGMSLWNIEGARRAAEEAPRLEAEREAKRKEAEERPAREAAEQAAKERAAREAGERAGREAATRTQALHDGKCVVPLLRGDSLAVAKRALRRDHCRLGRVTVARPSSHALVVGRQSIRSGRILAGGAKIALVLAPKHS